MAIYLSRCFQNPTGNLIPAGSIDLSGMDLCKGLKLLLNSASDGLSYHVDYYGDCPDGSPESSYSGTIDLTDTGSQSTTSHLGLSCYEICNPIYSDGKQFDAIITHTNGNLYRTFTDCSGSTTNVNSPFGFYSKILLMFTPPDFNNNSNVYYYAEASNLTIQSGDEVVVDGFTSNGSMAVTVNELNFSIPFYNYFHPSLPPFTGGATIDGYYNFSASYSFSLESC